MSEVDTSMREELVNCLSQQISEFELLQSMYPSNSEIVLTNKGILQEISNFLTSQSQYVPQNLDFVLNLSLNESKVKVEMLINLPLTYPTIQPDINIRCNQLNRQQETCLNTELYEFMKENFIGEVSLLNAITWVQDNIDSFISKQDCEDRYSGVDHAEEKFVRFWVHSHHIYNKKKREDILKKSKDLKLTGFCLPGKPGVICVEGDESACKKWWKIIKSMSWQKIMLKKTETFDKSEVNNRKFKYFQELHFSSANNTKHANMSEFSKFMSNHGLSDTFHELFDLCGD